MSVDQTIQELSGTLAQLGTLVGHINGQISGITSRINLTLDNFDQAVANIARDAGSVTYQVGDTVSQVPNAWVFYLLFITLIIVFILLSVVLILSVVTRLHVVWTIVRKKDDSERVLIPSRDSMHKSPASASISTPYSRTAAALYSPAVQQSTRSHISIPMEQEPRRLGGPPSTARREDTSIDDPRPYQRRADDSGRYNIETGTTTSYPRSLEV